MSNFHLKIVSLDGIFFDGEAQRVSLRTIDGEIAILAGHIPFVTAIGEGECRVVVEGVDKVRRAACFGGFLNVTKEEVLVAATTFEWAEDIDVHRASQDKEEAERILSTNGSEDHSIQVAKIKRNRANVRLKVIENNK